MNRKRKKLGKMTIETIDQYIEISSQFIDSEIEVFENKKEALEYIDSLYGQIEGSNDDIVNIIDAKKFNTYVRYFFHLSQEDYETTFPLGEYQLFDYEYSLQVFLNENGEEITNEEDLNEQNLVKTIRIFNIKLMPLSDITKKKEDDEVGLIIESWNDVMDDDQYTSANEEDEESTDETSDKKSDLNKNKINNSKETTGAKPKQKKKTVEEYEKELKAYEKTEQFEKCLEIKKKIDKLLASKKKK
jgi:hypothetical protein